MPTVTIQGSTHKFDERDVITFAEGLVGLPQIRKAVVISMNGLEPFCWLAPLDNTEARFVVVDPKEIFDGYQPEAFGAGPADEVQTYAIVTVASDWTKTTVNLRAPITIDRSTRTASQRVLTDSPYRFAESLPQG